MLFNSIHFLIFFPLVVTLYFLIPHRYRWFLLLISSYYFYMSWRLEYVILILLSTIVDYLAGIAIYNTKNKKKKKIFLGISLFINLGLLFAFKYFNFFSESIRALLTIFTIQLHPITLKWLLPVGISFYTFQTISYTIDVYREKIKPEKHFGIFAVYVSFFPQLVAGPIERAKHLLPQFYQKHLFDYKRITDGIKLMLWGIFKKVVIADKLAIFVDAVYNNPTSYSSSSLIIATFLFAFQIYCDFSGYSDIAIGSAQVMGFDLMDNFKRPYFSRSITEFWQRWHISLYSWFRDYIYIPLGGNRVSKLRHFLNVFIVFFVSGLWHGANWTFVLWGSLHGFYLIFGEITKHLRQKLSVLIFLSKFPKIHSLLQISITFLLISFSWIFFRANNFSDLIYILKSISINFVFDSNKLGFNFYKIIIAGVLILVLESVHLLQSHIKMREFLSERPLMIRWFIYLLLILFILTFGVFNNGNFIYFQF